MMTIIEKTDAMLCLNRQRQIEYFVLEDPFRFELPLTKPVFITSPLKSELMNLRKKILIADNAHGIAALHNILGETVELIEATTFTEAVDALRNPVDGVICGVHFDESRMFNLLAHTRADERTRAIPFLVFRDQQSELDATFFRSLEISVSSFGSAAFVDLFSLKDKFGVRNADAQLRDKIFALISSE
jgi:hypothetical protein